MNALPVVNWILAKKRRQLLLKIITIGTIFSRINFQLIIHKFQYFTDKMCIAYLIRLDVALIV
jgi:hypothetical protein